MDSQAQEEKLSNDIKLLRNAGPRRLYCRARITNARKDEASESRMSTLKETMEALKDPNIYTIGVCGGQAASLSETVKRRVKRDNLFGKIVQVSVAELNPNLRRIQEEIARELAISFQDQGEEEKSTAFCVFSNSNNKASVTENARMLSDRIRQEPNILFILDDLQDKLDLAKLGIPFGEDHKGCKLILTSESETILSNQMSTQRTFII